jgi:hypothetical protein
MEQFTKEDFERLAEIESENCVSIFIPTHQSGIKVNEGVDQITFKNHIQKIQIELEKKGHRNLSSFVDRAYRLLDDNSFWKEQSKGLAVFFNDDMFEVFCLPVPFREFSSIAKKYVLTPILSLMIEGDEFYTLSLSHKRIRLFKNTTFNFEEINISGLVPQNADEVFSYYEFRKEIQGKNMDLGGLKRSKSKANIIIHGHNPEYDEDKYVFEFLRKVNDGIMNILKTEHSPLVVAAAEYVFSIYKKANTYQNLIDESIPGNPDRLNEYDLHEGAYSIVKNKLNTSRKKDIEKYPAWAGTGKTSYDLNVILSATYDGRVESLFIEEGKELWGKYDPEKRTTEVHSEKQKDDIALYSLAAAKTIENNGKAYLVSSKEMPEKNFNGSVAAVLKY